MSVAASSPFNYVQSVVRKAHREFDEKSTALTRQMAMAWKGMLSQAECTSSDMISRRDFVRDDIENLLIRCDLYDAQRHDLFKPLGTRYEFDHPLTEEEKEEFKKKLRELGFAKLTPHLSLSDNPPSIWFPYSENELTCHFINSCVPLEGPVLSDCHKKLLKRKKEEFLKEAEAFCQEKRKVYEVICSFSQEALSSDKRLIDEILVDMNFDGVFLGEAHGQVSPYKFLIDNLENFKQAGVTTLFFEEFDYTSMQHHLDSYLSSASDTMHPALNAWISVRDRRDELTGVYSRMNLLKKAKALGIRIVGIDAKIAGWKQENWKKRTKAMNYYSYRVIERERGAGKFVVKTGACHGPTILHKDGSLIPGLADLFQCPFISLEDSETGPRVESDLRGFELIKSIWPEASLSEEQISMLAQLPPEQVAAVQRQLTSSSSDKASSKPQLFFLSLLNYAHRSIHLRKRYGKDELNPQTAALFSCIQGVVREAHRKFRERSTIDIERAAQRWKIMVRDQKVVGQQYALRRDILLDDIENLLIRCSLADSKKSSEKGEP